MPTEPTHREFQWQGISLSLQGTSHQATGTGCQDASGHRLLHEGQGPLAIAVAADGAGSSHQAAEAANIAVKASLNHNTGTPEEATAQARKAVLNRAEISNRPINDYHTTLMVAHCLPDTITWAHTGDGAIVAIDPQGIPTLLSPPEQGEYANETRFITDPQAPNECRTGTKDNSNVAALCLFTDGLQRMVLNYCTGQPQPHPAFFKNLWDWLKTHPSQQEREQGLLSLLTSDRVRTRTSDDVTLTILVKKPLAG